MCHYQFGWCWTIARPVMFSGRLHRTKPSDCDAWKTKCCHGFWPSYVLIVDPCMPLCFHSKVILELPALSYIITQQMWLGRGTESSVQVFFFLKCVCSIPVWFFRMEVVASDTFFYDEMAYSWPRNMGVLQNSTCAHAVLWIVILQREVRGCLVPPPKL